MKNILDVNVSQFNNYYTKENPITVNLYKWLKNDQYKLEVEKIREIKDKKERNAIKATLPAITPSGLFSKCNTAGLTESSGIICLDIDYKDNYVIKNFHELKTEFCKLKNVAYCGLSVSGEGYFLMIPISEPEKHKEHFLALENDFKRFNVKIDPACKDMCRLRGYSWDDNAYFNLSAETYTKQYSEIRKQKPIGKYEGNTNEKVDEQIRNICSSGIVLANSYEEWIKICFALISEFGSSARDMFHAISSQHPKYDFDETEKQFNYCLNSKGNGIGIGTFFYYFNQIN